MLNSCADNSCADTYRADCATRTLSGSLNGSSPSRAKVAIAGWELTRRCRSKDKFYLVFELAAGGELYDHLMAQVRFKEDEAKEVAHALVVSLWS